MDIDRLSPSSYGRWEFCQHAYFLEQNLKYRYPAGKAAQIGTVVHRVLELLALIKLQEQTDPNTKILSVEGDKNDASEITVDITSYTIDSLLDNALSEYDDDFFVAADLRAMKKYIDYAITWDGCRYDPRNLDIIAPERRIKINLDDDWAILPNGERFFISGIIDLVTKTGDNTYEIIDWKGLPVDTLLPSVDGWKTMGSINVGDTVFDENGDPTKVLGKSNASYKKCYKIAFDDKTTCICDDQHLWKRLDGSVVQINMLNNGDKIQITKPLVMEKKDLEIDPYVLGIWLGDDRNRSGEISMSERFVLDEIKARGYKVGPNIEARYGKCPQHTVYGLTPTLRRMGVLNNKHIPDIYKMCSIDQRIDLLRGLMDSDGNVNLKRKQCVFTNTNKKLSDDVKELLTGLGQRVNQAHITRVINEKKINIYPLHYRPINLNPFLMPRKSSKVSPKWGPGRSNYRKIIGITKIKTELKTQCIMVDSKHSTYLCTKDMIVTHNTGMTKDFNTGKEKGYVEFCDDPQLRFYHLAATQLYGIDANINITIFFIKAKECHTIPFTPDDIPRTKQLIRARMEEIIKCQEPKLNRGWKCTKFCPFGKKTAEGTNFPKLKQSMAGGIAKIGQDMTICDCSNSLIRSCGIDYVQANLGKYSKDEK